ncbi:MAG: 5'-3'-deoxyribonucleotidase, partial [Nanoarchaeota archaeon]|nr:5'-3'-deoxyribonucleotidase [Nanoarchaeota archaeon]
MAEKRLILVDMDDVLADFEGEFERRWCAVHRDKIGATQAERNSVYMKRANGGVLRPLVEEIYRTPGFILSLPPIEGGLEAVVEMLGLGHDVFICTKPIRHYPDCALQKYHWIEEKLGIDWARRMILTKDKTLFRGDYLIDDKPEITGILQPVWEHILYDQYYNRDVKGKRRLTWKNWREVLN